MVQFGLMNNPGLPVEEEIAAIGEAGFDYVELTLEPPCSQKINIPRIKTLLKKYNMGVVGHTDPRLPFVYPVPGIRKACLGEFKRFAQIFARLGAEIMNIHPCWQVPRFVAEHTVEWNIAALREIAGIVRKQGMAPVIENMFAPFDTVAVFKRIFETIPDAKLHLDVGHAHLGRDTGARFCRAFPRRLSHIHVSDNHGVNDEHFPLGMGSIDWPKMVLALKKIKYNKRITLEIFLNHSSIMKNRYILESRNYLQELWKKT